MPLLAGAQVGDLSTKYENAQQVFLLSEASELSSLS